MFQTIFAEKIEGRILVSIIFFANLAFYETMWKNMVELDISHTTVQ